MLLKTIIVKKYFICKRVNNNKGDKIDLIR